MKKILSVLLLLSMQVFGQTNMYLSSDTLDEIPIDGLYYEHTYYLLCKKGVFSFDVNPLLLEKEGFTSYLVRLDEDLNPIDSLEFPPYEGYLVDGRNLLIQNDTIYALGRAIKPDTSDEQIFLASVSMDLELMHFSLIGSLESNEFISNAIINSNNHILISAIDYNDLENSHFIAYECDKTGNILQFAEDTSWHTSYAFAIQLPISNAYHFIGHNYISIYNSELEKDTILRPKFYNHFLYRGLNASYKEDTYFIGGNDMNVWWGSSTPIERDDEDVWDIAYYQVDGMAEKKDSGYIFLPDTNDIAGGMDFLPPRTLFLSGIHNFDFTVQYPGFRTDSMWLVVQSLNYETRQVNWLFEYGGDVCYEMKGLNALPNGGAVVYGTRYDWPNTDILQRDIIILRIDSTGLLVGNKDIYEIDEENPITIFPNPGLSLLNIVTRAEYDLELYNLEGRLVFKRHLRKGTNSLQTNFLPAGVYIYRLTNQSCRDYLTGKWIKKQ